MVSIIIVNFNTKELLKQLLTSITQNVKNVTYEIIVVDNNSTDGSKELLKTLFKKVILIANKSNLGFGKANNQGAKVAQGKYLLLLNSDTLVCENAIDKMFQFLEKEKSVAAVGSKLLNRDGSLQSSWGMFPKLKTEFYFRTFLNQLFPTNRISGLFRVSAYDHSAVKEVDWVSGACMMIRKEVFDKIVGFDEQIYMYYEDADLCLRIKKLGWKVYFLPHAQIYHFYGSSWKKNRERAILFNCMSSLHYFRKHHRKWQTYVLKIFMIIETLMAYLILTPILILKGEEYKDIRSRLRGYTNSLKYIT